MSEWIDGFAQAMGVPPLTAAETDRLLQAARDVAHRTERKETPVAAFLMGMGVATRICEGDDREIAFEDAVRKLLNELPSQPPGA